jgi:hypothetical protein
MPFSGLGIFIFALTDNLIHIISLLCINSSVFCKPRNSVQIVTLLTSIRAMPGSYLDRNTKYRD